MFQYQLTTIYILIFKPSFIVIPVLIFLLPLSVKPSSVRDVEAAVTDKDKITISWRAPETGGKVKGYKVVCGDVVVDVPEDVSYKNIYLLKPFSLSFFL